MPIQEGPPIYAESLLSGAEWADNLKRYTTCTNKLYPQFFKSEFAWRLNMGGGLTADRIAKHNIRIEQLRKLLSKEE